MDAVKSNLFSNSPVLASKENNVPPSVRSPLRVPKIFPSGVNVSGEHEPNPSVAVKG
jgi:hypothetical protein